VSEDAHRSNTDDDRSAHSLLKARAFGAPPGGIELDRSGDRATNALLLRHYTTT
jgi:hypothetical protein